MKTVIVSWLLLFKESGYTSNNCEILYQCHFDIKSKTN